MEIELPLSPMETKILGRDIADREARVRALVAAHFDRVWRSLRRLGVPEELADDAAQEVFTVVARKLDAIEAGGERHYLHGVALRVASQARRTQRRRREDVDADLDARPAPAALNPEDLVDQKRALERLHALLDAMPFDLRAAFVFFELDGLTVPELARALEVPLGTAASRLRRARETFRVLVGAATRGQR